MQREELQEKVESSAANQWEPAGSDSAKPCFVSSLHQLSHQQPPQEAAE